MQAFANPKKFLSIAKWIEPIAYGVAGIAFILGLFFGLSHSPADYQQGDTVRIMYVHVPAAWMALFCYSTMAIASVTGFIWKHPLADMTAKTTAPIGALFTALALITGSLWGKPMWGTWWAWDARLTSVLVLLFMYLGYIAIWMAIDDKARAAKIAAISTIVGFVNIPIIKFSVDWWNSLHQPASIIRADGPAIDPSMLTPLLLMAIAYQSLYVALLMTGLRSEITERRISRLEAQSSSTRGSKLVGVQNP